MLDQNFEYIKLIADCQKKGRTAEATQYSSQLHNNLATMARVADTDLPADIAQVNILPFFAIRTASCPSPAVQLYAHMNTVVVVCSSMRKKQESKAMRPEEHPHNVQSGLYL